MFLFDVRLLITPWVSSSISSVIYRIAYSNMTSFFRFVNKRSSYPFGIISLAHAPANVTDFSIDSIYCKPNNADRGRSIIRVNLCATFSASVNINYCLPVKVDYRICTFRHIRIEITHGSQNVF